MKLTEERYNLVNNTLGWLVFAVALVTYWLTLEPTASYWDCGEFIIQADKLEIGHPPGNPIFMLTARFFANFAFGDPMKVALMVNAMSGLLSALTILLLFWTITHLAKRLVCRGGAVMNRVRYALVMGSGLCGALAYTWSDTFWFSAVEGEVYAFSSFCTALVFWLILKWENRADSPHSDRYLVLIAYVIGVSVAVHLLNLLCIPAIVLVYYFRKAGSATLKGSVWSLLAGFGIIVLVLYGLVPGFIRVAGEFELACVNWLSMPFNSGTVVYTALLVACMCWALWELYAQRSGLWVRVSVFAATLLSGMLFIGGSLWAGLLLTAVLGWLLWGLWGKRLPVRWVNVAMWSMAMIFVGYSSYALILLRSNAGTPMNQNAPDNVFALSSYLNREQYGKTPLLYGQTFQSRPEQVVQADGYPVTTVVQKGKAEYARGVKGAQTVSANGFLSRGELQGNEKLAARGGDYYALYDYEAEYPMNKELNMLLPRIHSTVPEHLAGYKLWVPGLERDAERVTLTGRYGDARVPMVSGDVAYNELGEPYYVQKTALKPTMGQNLGFFLNYQLNHMYWRYFLWNFAGRQNDINNQNGELDAGNWISGIPFIDNARLGDQSLLPDELGSGNKGHNVFYMLPLLLGLVGLLWQAMRGRRGIEQFWVVFFLFFMTGIAIVLYLNQPPLQPRERDYAYAGSFYAFAIWIGLGVAGLYYTVMDVARRLGRHKGKVREEDAEGVRGNVGRWAVGVALAAALGVPLQMVSQTWDDHDRSGRTAARDYARNYLNSLEENAIVFCNGDNDTFPLWYVQEVEGVRPDVKIVNLSYLNSGWYADQMRQKSYTAPGIEFTATPADYAYDQLQIVYPTNGSNATDRVPLLDAIKEIYADKSLDEQHSVRHIPHLRTYLPVDSAAVAKAGLLPEGVSPVEGIDVNLDVLPLGKLLMLDIIATNAARGWERPIYWAMSVGEDNYREFAPYLRSVGMALQLVPYRADRLVEPGVGYGVVMDKYVWGGADRKDYTPYFDETAGRMLASTRLTVLDLANALIAAGDYDRAMKVLAKFEAHLSGGARAMSYNDVLALGQAYCMLGEAKGDKKLLEKGQGILADGLKRFARNVLYAMALGEKFGFDYEPIGGVDVPVLAVQTTPETAVALYRYYELAEAYAMYAGEKKAAEVMRRAGIGDGLQERLRSWWAAANGGGASGLDAEQTAMSVAKCAEVVVELQGLSPEEYAARTEVEREVDSTFVLILEQYVSEFGSEEALLRYEIFDRIDAGRSRRLHDEYVKRHADELVGR